MRKPGEPVSRAAPGGLARSGKPDVVQRETVPDDGTAGGVTLTDDERARIDARAGRGLVRAVAAQGLMGLLAALAAWAVAGAAAGWSALAGAGAYFLPNALFALRLFLAGRRPDRAHPFTFLFGEAFKLAATVLLLWLAVRVGGEAIVWPALLAGLVCVLKGYVLLLMFRRLS